MQIIIHGENLEQRLSNEINRMNIHRILLVHGHSFNQLSWKKYFDKYAIVDFTEFSVNPRYEEAVVGKQVYLDNRCDAIVAVGGGSAIDTAKCIKAFMNMNSKDNYLEQQVVSNDIPFISIPTTAGTGSESTRFAVIYYQGVKHSVTDDSLIPQVTVLDESVLEGLPKYQRKATMCDALAHGIESYWAVNANEESRTFAEKAIRSIMDNWKKYVAGECNKEMLIAANNAGKAIDISTTTAGHAMSYKVTSMFGIAHGQAAIICIPVIWQRMVYKNTELDLILEKIAEIMGCKDSNEAIDTLKNMIDTMDLIPAFDVSNEQLEILVDAVNPGRISNNPVKFDREELRQIYREVFEI